MKDRNFYPILLFPLLAFVPDLVEPLLARQELVVRAMMLLFLVGGMPGVGGTGG